MASSRRDAEAQRERDRKEDRERRMLPPTSRAPTTAAARTHEYFVPKDGIDREVITADICRYLGNDALVRPGIYENPSTGQRQQGYFITAYRNLTGAMIEDLKLDSDRWESERRAAAAGRSINGTSLRDSGGHRTSNAHSAPSYLMSRTHESRQHYGHSGPPEPQPPQSQPFNSMISPQDRYSNEPPYMPPQQAQPGLSNYGPGQSSQGQFPIHQDSRGGEYAYVSGAHFVNDSRVPNGRIPVTQGGQIPRGDVYMQGAPTSQYPPQDGRFSQYSAQVPISSAPPFNPQQDYYSGPSRDYQDSPMAGYSDPRPSYSEHATYSSPGPGVSAPAPVNPTMSASANSSIRREHRGGDDRRRDDRDRHDRRR